MGSALRSRPWLLWLLLLGLVVMSLGVVAVVRARGDRGGHGAALAKYGFRQRQEKAKEGGESEGGSRHGAEEREVGESEEQAEREHGEEGDKEGEKRDPHEAAATILGREGGEGDRHGANTPWGEQVGNRAYPRSYVDDRLAVKSRRAFERMPSSAPRAAFKTSRAYRAARAAAPGTWDGPGPDHAERLGRGIAVLRPGDAGGADHAGVRARDRDRGRPGLRRRGELPRCGSRPPVAASGAPTTRWRCTRSGSRRRRTCRRTRSAR